jgi:hypothetical protein
MEGRWIYDMRAYSKYAMIVDAVVPSSRPRFMSQQRVHSTKVAMDAVVVLCIHYATMPTWRSEFFLA